MWGYFWGYGSSQEALHGHTYPHMALNPAAIEALTPRASPYKATDSKGLYLLILPNGARYWRFRFRWAGRQNTMSCGVYPATSLEEARERRDAARRMLAEGISPSEHRKLERAASEGERAQQAAATRFMLGNDGALAVRLGGRHFSLSPAETADLRAFLDATRTVAHAETSCL